MATGEYKMSVLACLAILAYVASLNGDDVRSSLKVFPVAIGEDRAFDLELKPGESEPTYSRRDWSNLWILFDVQGKIVEKVTHYGHVRITSATDNRGRSLKVNTNAYWQDAVNGYVQINRHVMFPDQDEPPNDRVRIRLHLDVPQRTAESVSVCGTVRLKISEVGHIGFGELPQKTGRIDNAESAKLGLRLELTGSSESAGMKSFSFEVGGKSERVLNALLLDHDGQFLTASGLSPRRPNGKREFFVQLGAQASAHAELVLTVEVGEESFDVPFEFKDLRLP